ncbi:hypothetical protein [Paraburkholderia tropica]|uniref:hypothetical protein n=3 Tax=Burkholderiaceae TaxID=119060 RepID=UPI001628F38B|nr:MULTISPECIES: hypothetical protein [Paraburkholderia]
MASKRPVRGSRPAAALSSEAGTQDRNDQGPLMSTSETRRKPPQPSAVPAKKSTNEPAATSAKNAGLLPARLADAQLDHVERMVQFLSFATVANATRGIDREYCRKRLQTLEQTHDLVASQRSRIAKLLHLLERVGSTTLEHALTRSEVDPAARFVAPRGEFAA